MALWLIVARAQGKVPVIGYLYHATPDYQPAAVSFLKGLAEAGYIEGKNCSLEYHWAEGHYDRLPAMASELVGLGVDLIAAFGPPPAKAAKAAKAATSLTPITILSCLWTQRRNQPRALARKESSQFQSRANHRSVRSFGRTILNSLSTRSRLAA